MYFTPSSVVLLLSLVLEAQSQGLFGGLANFFRGLGGSPRRPPGPQAVRGGRVVGGGQQRECPSSGPNHSFGGQQYLITWRLGWEWWHLYHPWHYLLFFTVATHLLRLKEQLIVEQMECLWCHWRLRIKKESSLVSLSGGRIHRYLMFVMPCVVLLKNT